MASFPPREDMLTLGQISFFLILVVWVVLRNIPKKKFHSHSKFRYLHMLWSAKDLECVVSLINPGWMGRGRSILNVLPSGNL